MKKVAALLALALASLALVACGGDDDGTTTTTTSNGGDAGGAAAGGGNEKAGGGGATLKFEADPAGGLAYTTTEATTEAGDVTVDFDNPQGVTHDVAFEDEGGETVGQTDLITSETTSTKVNFKPGTYTFYCSVPGHREAGMEGTLTVE